MDHLIIEVTANQRSMRENREQRQQSQVLEKQGSQRLSSSESHAPLVMACPYSSSEVRAAQPRMTQCDWGC